MLAGHLSTEELGTRLKESCSIEQHRRWQVIYLRSKNPLMSVREVAEFCCVPYRTVTQWTWFYNTQGPEEYVLLGRGGRRNAHLSEEGERELLLEIESKAERGVIITVRTVKLLAEKKIGRELPKDYAYDLLHRNNWRKVKPHTHHPNGNKEVREAFKKSIRNSWLPAEKN